MVRRLRRVALVLATASALVIGLAAAPAQAASGSWGTFAKTCRASSCVNNGNLVRLWQAILWADGQFAGTGSIDGDFGNGSHNATFAWQSQYGGGADGVVGVNTWKAAEFQRLDIDDDGDICRNGSYGYTYHGWSPAYGDRSFKLRMRCGDLYWTFQNPRTGGWTDTNYNY